MRKDQVCVLLFMLIAGAAAAPFMGGARALAAESASGTPIATVARTKAAPTVDGRIADGEWADALLVQPFMGFQRARVEPRPAKAYVTFTNERLYVAVVSGIPPSGPRANKKFRDAQIIFDSCIELWIDPNRENRGSGEGSLGYYKFMGNPIDTIKDMRFDPQGAPDVGWNADWQYKNTFDTETQTWTAEVSVPWTDLGWEDGKPVGRSIGLLIARNFKRGWNQTVWLPLGASFVNKDLYPLIKLTEEAPTVRVESLGDRFLQGEVDMRLRVRNPGPARRAKVDVKLTSSNMPQILGQKELELPANGHATYRFSVPEGRLHADARHTMNLTVKDAKSDAIYLQREGVNWTAPTEPIWRKKDMNDPSRAVELSYYPSYQFVRFKIEPSFLGKDAPESKSAQVSITGPDGKQVASQKLEWEKAPHTQRIEVGEMKGGEYEATVTLAGRDEPIKRHFTRRHFPWEGNSLGITDKVYPPFEPVRVEEDRVTVVQRRYQKTGLGLWQSVQAVDTELLAEPMVLRVNGDTSLTGDGRFTERDEQKAVYRGKAEHAAVNVQTRTITEYDGAMRVEMDLMPGAEQKELQSLTLDIPIKDSVAPLYHVSTTALRVNPAGKTPAGNGHVWDTRDFPDGEWYGGFRPYIWLGGEQRGLSWFADNDKGWVIDVDAEEGTYDPALSLHRKDGVLTLRVHFVQKPITLENKRHIVFGLMASPAKPMPDDWRKIGRPDHPGFRFSMGHPYGLPETFSGKYPLHGDFSIFDAVQAQRLGAKVDLNSVHTAWMEANTRNMSEKLRKRYERLTRGGIRRGGGVGKDHFSVYFEEFHSTSRFHAEVPTFFSEWTGRRLPQDLKREPTEAGDWGPSIPTKNLAPSYRDFAVWYGAQWLRRGFGLYFDNAFPKRAYDTVTTNAYELPNGRVQPSAGMWAHRRFLRRIWVLHQQLYNPRTPQMMMIHMTNTHIVPFMVWNEANLDLEWLMTAEPAQSKYAPDLLRAQSLGRQTGNIPFVLALTRKGEATEEERQFAKRTRWGAMLVHEIKRGISSETYPEPLSEFGYGLDDCTVYNYWDADAPLDVSDGKCKWMLLKRDGKLMVLLATWNGQPNDVTVSLNTDQLGMNASRAINAESDQTIAMEDNTFTFRMNGYGVRIFELK